MEQDIENLKRALFILWSWTFNPDTLNEGDLSWFNDFIVKTYAKKEENN